MKIQFSYRNRLLNNYNRTAFCWSGPRGTLAGAMTDPIPPSWALALGSCAGGARAPSVLPKPTPAPHPSAHLKSSSETQRPQPFPRCPLQKMNGRSSICHVLCRGPPRAALMARRGWAGRQSSAPTLSGHQEGADSFCSSPG